MSGPVPFDTSILQPGDCLLYAPSGTFGWVISIKSWHAISHVEIYAGDGESVASRDPDSWFPKPHGGGVNRYPLRTSNLVYVLRPIWQLDLAPANRWFETVRGQAYDWLGLLRFSWRSAYVPSKYTANKQFCSELATRYYRHAHIIGTPATPNIYRDFPKPITFDPFPRDDADAIAPFQFLDNPAFTLVWSAKEISNGQAAA